MSRPHTVVAVDHELQWVVVVPEVLAGSARTSTAEQRAGFEAQFRALAEALRDRERTAAIIAAAVQAALDLAGRPPDLPFIGEPFGGVEGSD